MRILTLNIYGGRLKEELLSFFASRPDVDIFCLQEVYSNADGKDTIWHGANFNSFEDIKSVLPEYTPHYHPHLGDWWGLASFIKKDIPVLECGETYVHLHKGHNMEIEVYGHTAKNLQYVKVESSNGPVYVINFHGLWNGMGKNDSEARLAQSHKAVEFIKGLQGEVVLCGDFNLLPNTESIKILEDAGLRNLVREYGVTSTRTPLYTKPEKFADYVFVSEGLTVTNFQVLPDIVSDHSPLLVEIER